MTTRTLNEVTVYWDTQDPKNEGWAWKAKYSDGHADSGPADGDGLGDAIEDACQWIDGADDLTPDDFGEPEDSLTAWWVRADAWGTDN